MTERVALIGDNSIEFIKLLFAIWNNHECAVLIDPQIPIQASMGMMKDAEVKKCYIEQKYYSQVNHDFKRMVEFISYDTTGITPQLLSPKLYDDFNICYSKSEAVIIYSSGTTGNSKGIILSHYAINTNADAIIDYMKPTSDDRIYILRNLTHSSTLTGELLVAIKAKIPILIAPVKMPPRYVLNNISKYDITIIGINPLLLSMYAEECNKRNYNISSLKKIYVSGSILSDQIYDMAHKIFHEQEIYNVYGLSEAAPRVTAQRKECSKSNSVGKPIAGVSVVIVDDNGLSVPQGDYGIIHILTPIASMIDNNLDNLYFDEFMRLMKPDYIIMSCENGYDLQENLTNVFKVKFSREIDAFIESEYISLNLNKKKKITLFMGNRPGVNIFEDIKNKLTFPSGVKELNFNT